MNPVSDEKVNTAIQRLTENPKLSASQLSRDEVWGKTTAWRAWKVAKEHLEREERDNGLPDNPGNELMEGSQVARVQGGTQDARERVKRGEGILDQPVKPLYGRRGLVSRNKVEQAKRLLGGNPSITGPKVAKELQCCEETGARALRVAKEECLQNTTDLREKAMEVRSRQQEKAIQALDSQLTRTDDLPVMLCRLREETFEMDPDTGEIVGIKPMVKGFNKAGDEILLTPAAVIKEYLEAEKLILEQERKVTGITQAERLAEKSASPKPEFTLQLPITPDQLDQIKPV